MISIPISLKKDELFLNFFSNCNLSIHCYSLSVSVLSLSLVAIISSIESGIVPRFLIRFLLIIYFFLLIAHTTIPMIISSIGTAIIMISPVITACSVFIVILLKV